MCYFYPFDYLHEQSSDAKKYLLLLFCPQIEKFAVRFPQPCDAESFLNCVKVYTSGVLQDVVAAREMTADKVEGAGKEIDITIKRGIMPSIKVPHEESSDLVSHEVTEQFHVYNIYFSGRVIWPMEAFMICNSVIFLFSGSKKANFSIPH
jgi:hypothetical protein